ncbi:cytosine permease [Streptomyces sp. NPDC059009]|uniref:cytosine permease n=1 Tax=Streptomyces sp. NPDC059009 TaxID=3346694 RepID=UPI0036901562
MLRLIVVITGPAMAMAVAATGLALRRNRYHGEELLEQQRGGPFWYRGGLHWPGLSALLTGGLAALMWVSATLWTGLLATATGGVDPTVPVGMGVAALVYRGLARTLRTIGFAAPAEAPTKGRNLRTPTSS